MCWFEIITLTFIFYVSTFSKHNIIMKMQATAGQYSVVVACRVVWKPIPTAKGQWPSHTALVGALYRIGREKMSTFIIIHMIIWQRVSISNLNHSIYVYRQYNDKIYFITYKSDTLMIITLINCVLRMY